MVTDTISTTPRLQNYKIFGHFCLTYRYIMLILSTKTHDSIN